MPVPGCVLLPLELRNRIRCRKSLTREDTADTEEARRLNVVTFISPSVLRVLRVLRGERRFGIRVGTGR